MQPTLSGPVVRAGRSSSRCHQNRNSVVCRMNSFTSRRFERWGINTLIGLRADFTCHLSEPEALRAPHFTMPWIPHIVALLQGT